MIKHEYLSGDTIKYLLFKNEYKLGIIKSVKGELGSRIITLTDDSLIHENQIIFKFDFSNMN
jgi:hypothetical protein